MEREMKKGESTKAKGEEKRETVKAVRGREERKGGGGMSPMAATHHSQLNDAIFFPFSRFFSMGEAGGGLFQPASNQIGSNRVHILQVGPRELVRCRTRRDESISNSFVFKEAMGFSEANGRQNA